MTGAEEASTPRGADRVDEAIAQIERLYQAATGRPPAQDGGGYAPIPAEKDPGAFVDEQVDRLLTALGPPQPSVAPGPWSPPISIWEGDSEIVLAVELPGVPRDRVDVTVSGNLLRVAGNRPAETSRDGAPLRISERPFGPFARQVLLPTRVRSADLTATMRDGVLELRIPREGLARPQSVTIR